MLREFIEHIALNYSVTYKDNEYIDKHNILKSTQDSRHCAIKSLNIEPELILVDGNIFNSYYNEENDLIEHITFIGGDDKYLPDHYASILNKT